MALVAASGDILLKSVLVATDFSEASHKAFRHALAIARHYGAKLYVAHIVSSLGLTLVGPEAVTAARDAVCRDTRRMEEDLVKTGALGGLGHEVIIRQGNVWEGLETIISEERLDLVVLGTHARRGLGKLLLGSVAEHIFRNAGCLVLTVGPGSLQDSPVGSARPIQPFLFATDFSEPSLHALPYAISSANHFGAKLVLLHVVADIPIPRNSLLPTADETIQMQERVRVANLQRLEELTSLQPQLAIQPGFCVAFGSPSDKILETARTIKADTIILGLHHKKHTEAASHMPWATAYEVVCGACCSVLTVRS